MSGRFKRKSCTEMTGNDQRQAFWRAVRQKRLHRFCEFCARRQGMPECPAINDPVKVWEGGDCWAYTEDASAVEEAERAVREYAKRRRAMPA